MLLGIEWMPLYMNVYACCFPTYVIFLCFGSNTCPSQQQILSIALLLNLVARSNYLVFVGMEEYRACCLPLVAMLIFGDWSSAVMWQWGLQAHVGSLVV